MRQARIIGRAAESGQLIIGAPIGVHAAQEKLNAEYAEYTLQTTSAVIPTQWITR
jgi:hypothetical protein